MTILAHQLEAPGTSDRDFAGYLGGAVATHVRVGDPLVSHVLFPTYVGLLLWAGLYLRDSRLRALIPFRGKAA